MTSRALCVIVVASATWAAPCRAQDPEGAGSWFTRHVRVSGEASASVSTHDAEDEGWFNYSDYDTSTVRSMRLSLVAEVTLSRRFAVLTEVRSLQLERPEAYALYLRIRPWLSEELDIHVGRVPPTFGAFPRRLYVTDNPLVGTPLAYQYLTSSRADALPATGDEFAAMRARGWLATYSRGNTEPAAGLPLANALRWDTGVQVRWRRDPVTVYTAVTQGTLGDPRLSADNGGVQVAGRVVYAPHPAVSVGGSVATGPYLAESLSAVLPASSRLTSHAQRAYGADAEVSRDRWLVRAEWVANRWEQPSLDASVVRPLDARATMVEAKYTIVPGVYVAGRADWLDFSRIDTSRGPVTWDADVRRTELGAGWRVHRHVLLKAAWQRNRRSAGRVRTSDIGAMQVVAWF